MLTALGVDFKKMEIGDCWLIYDFQGPIYPRTLFGPVVKIKNQRLRLCEKEVRFQWNKTAGRGERLKLHLYSPFEFSHLHWYGDYFQEVEAFCGNRRILSTRLQDGENVIGLTLDDVSCKEKNPIIKLRFKYHLPFSFAYFWKTAALLGPIGFE
ncbi:MAG: hypothetical protein WCC06_10925 [Candidatus Aminicenantales bacterium]